MEGRVKFFKDAEAWGFITADGKDYFFHASGLIEEVKRLDKGTPVEFELDPSNPRGPEAIKIRVLRDEEGADGVKKIKKPEVFGI